jgi:hypothetical protein
MKDWPGNYSIFLMCDGDLYFTIFFRFFSPIQEVNYQEFYLMEQIARHKDEPTLGLVGIPSR